MIHLRTKIELKERIIHILSGMKRNIRLKYMKKRLNYQEQGFRVIYSSGYYLTIKVHIRYYITIENNIS